MKIVKTENTYRLKTMPAIWLASILLDLRALCSHFDGYVPRSNVSIEIVKKLKESEKEHLFNVSNFDPDLLMQCREITKIQSTKPAYLTFNHLERLELEQASFLSSDLPIYPENKKLYLTDQLQQILRRKRGENHGNFKWE